VPRVEALNMSAKRAIGILLIIVGIVALVWGGVFWTERDTLVDAGPLEIQTEDREGVAMPPILGAIALIGGIVLVAIPERRRA
jgi:drug/metabolite transporter (DMT)-like permease